MALWLATDAAVYMLSYALAYFLRVGWVFSSDFPFGRFLVAAALSAPLWLAVLLTTRAFGLTRTQWSPRNAAYITYANVVGTAFFALTYYFLFGAFFSRLLLIQALVIATILVWQWHILWERFLRKALTADPLQFPTLVVGVTRESKQLIALLKRRRNPLQPVAILDGGGAREKEVEGVPVIGKLNKLDETLDRFRITHLIQCSELEQSLNLLSACRARGITYVLLPSVLGIIERDERVESLEGKAVTIVSPDRGAWEWFFR